MEIHLLWMHLYLTCSLLLQVRLFDDWYSLLASLQKCPWHINSNEDEEMHHC